MWANWILNQYRNVARRIWEPCDDTWLLFFNLVTEIKLKEKYKITKAIQPNELANEQRPDLCHNLMLFWHIRQYICYRHSKYSSTVYMNTITFLKLEEQLGMLYYRRSHIIKLWKCSGGNIYTHLTYTRNINTWISSIHNDMDINPILSAY